MATARKRAYKGIRNAIIEGALVPGQHLTETYLANEFGISRTPVRQAIRALAVEGLVSVHDNKSASVVDSDQLDLEDLFHIRTFLETAAAKTAALRITDSQLEKLKMLHKKMIESDRCDMTVNTDFLRLASCFHRVIHRATGSETMFALLRRVADFTLLVDLKHQRKTESKLAIEHLSRILRAMEVRDPEIAALEMKIYLELVRRQYLPQTDFGSN